MKPCDNSEYITVQKMIDMLSLVKKRDRDRIVLFGGPVKSFDWMDVAEGILLFIETEETEIEHVEYTPEAMGYEK